MVRVLLKSIGKDGVAAIIFLLLTVWGFWETSSYPAQARMWPQWMLGLMGLLSLLMLVSGIRNARRGAREGRA